MAPRIVRHRPAMRKDMPFTALHDRLCFWRNLEGVPAGTYSVGMQVLCRMVSCNSTEVVMTWQELRSGIIVHNGSLIAGPAPGAFLPFLATLQDLQESVGVFNHVTQAGLAEDIEEARRTGRRVGHFTTEPGVLAEDVIACQTPIIFRFEQWAGENHFSYLDFIQQHCKTTIMPESLTEPYRDKE